MNDSVTSGLPLKQPNVGAKANGFDEPVMLSLKVNAHGGEDIVIEKKTAPAASKTEEKGELSMGPMISSGWKSKDYSAPVEESVSLGGKSTRMPETTSGGFAPQTVGVGQMKLEAPPQYSSKKKSGVRVWITQMERYMKLMCYAYTDWLMRWLCR